MTVTFLAEWKELLLHCKYDLLVDFETSGLTPESQLLEHSDLTYKEKGGKETFSGNQSLIK